MLRNTTLLFLYCSVGSIQLKIWSQIFFVLLPRYLRQNFFVRLVPNIDIFKNQVLEFQGIQNTSELYLQKINNYSNLKTYQSGTTEWLELATCNPRVQGLNPVQVPLGRIISLYYLPLVGPDRHGYKLVCGVPTGCRVIN